MSATDIVERLRAWPREMPLTSHQACDAADEISALRAEVRRLNTIFREGHDGCETCPVCDKPWGVTPEIEELLTEVIKAHTKEKS